MPTCLKLLLPMVASSFLIPLDTNLFVYLPSLKMTYFYHGELLFQSIYISRVTDVGAADKDSRLKVGDRIILVLLFLLLVALFHISVRCRI